MEKAIEIKRRAQRCILNGDLDGALVEYQRLIESGDSDPYHSVLLADLLFKKGDRDGAAERYLEAVGGYESGSLVKNAIAICKKMSRLGLAPAVVLERLGGLHAQDGLATEASLYYMQHAELVASERKYDAAERSLRAAFRVCPDNIQVLERLGELLERTSKRDEAARTFADAAMHHERLGQPGEAERCRHRAEELLPGVVAEMAGAARVPEPTPFSDPEPSTPRFSEGLSMENLDRAVNGEELEVRGVVAESGGEEYSEPESSDGRVVAAEGSNWNTMTEDAPVLEVGPAFEVDPIEADRPGLGLEARVEAKSEADRGLAGAAMVGELIQEARLQLGRGDTEEAGTTLLRAARGYEQAGQFENAATIYRTLSQSRQATSQVLLLWHDNCQNRKDLGEAARVACELGDRALNQNDVVEAREWFERARGYEPGNPLAQRRLQRLADPSGNGAVAGGSGPVAGPPRPDPSALPEGSVTTNGGMIQISSNREEPVVVQLGSLIAEFQLRIKEQVDQDHQSQYDLAMSYREMGLFDEAISSFESASAAPEFRVRCSEMIGRCYLDRGDLDRAAEQFRATLMLPNIHPDGALDVAYQLGLALEAGGRVTDALQQFERIYVVEPNYPGVAAKIRDLRKAQEQG